MHDTSQTKYKNCRQLVRNIYLRSKRTNQFYRSRVWRRTLEKCVPRFDTRTRGTVPLSATSLSLVGKSETRRVRWPRVDSLIWPGDLYCRKSIIFPIRSLGPIFRRRHFRLAVFLPIHVVYDYQPAPAWSPSTIPGCCARLGLSRTFDSLGFKPANLSSISSFSLAPAVSTAFYRARLPSPVSKTVGASPR